MLTKAELPECPVATTLQLIGNKWKMLILRNLMTRPWRFNEMLRSIPLSGCDEFDAKVYAARIGAINTLVNPVQLKTLLDEADKQIDSYWKDGDNSSRRRTGTSVRSRNGWTTILTSTRRIPTSSRRSTPSSRAWWRWRSPNRRPALTSRS